MSGRRASFDEEVYRLCRLIPCGRVTTYGRLASIIPPPPGMDPFAYEQVKARWVGYALAHCPDDVPWQRVLNARGESSLGDQRKLQQALLEQEGIEFDAHGRVNLARCLWQSQGEGK